MPTSGQYRLWSLPTWTNVAGNDAYLYLYDDESWFDYHVYQGVLELAGIRDNDASRRAEHAQRMSDAAEVAIGEWQEETARDGPHTWTRSEDW